IALRIAATTDNVKLPDGTVVQTASHSTIYAEMIKSMRRDGPLASAVSFGLVAIVVIFATSSARGAFVVLAALLIGVICRLGVAALFVVPSLLHVLAARRAAKNDPPPKDDATSKGDAAPKETPG